MSVILTDRLGKAFKVNSWNWGVLHHTLICCRPKLLDDDQVLEQLRFGGVELSEHEVEIICSYLEEVVLPRLKPGERMLPDFSITDEPDDGTFYRDEPEKNYSLSYDVLFAVIEFLYEAKSPLRVT